MIFMCQILRLDREGAAIGGAERAKQRSDDCRSESRNETPQNEGVARVPRRQRANDIPTNNMAPYPNNCEILIAAPRGQSRPTTLPPGKAGAEGGSTRW